MGRRGENQRSADVKKPRTSVRGFFTCLMPGSSLLSHGETPHYHRRYGVSLLSSAWGQVGPPRYSRQANLGARNEAFTSWPCAMPQNPSFPLIFIRHKLKICLSKTPLAL